MYKVLLVDDENLIIEGLKVMIGNMGLGFDCIELANNGVQAMEKLMAFKPDLIITDVKMPVKTGLDLIKEIRELPGDLQNIKIIVLSGYNEFDFARTAMKYGVNDYLLKPVDKDELYQILLQTSKCLDKAIEERLFAEKKNVLCNYALNYKKEKCFWDIFKQRITSNEDINKRLKDAGFVFTYENLVIVCFEPGYLDSANSDNITGSLDLTLFSIRNIAEECFTNEGLCFNAFQYNHHMVFLLCIPDTASHIELIKHACTVAQNNMEKFLQLQVFSGLSNSFRDVSDIFKAYNQCCYALRYRLIKPERKTISYTDVSDVEISSPVFYREIQNIISGIETGKRDEVSRQLDLIRETMKNREDISINYLENSYYNVYVSVFSYFFNSHKDLPAVYEIPEIVSRIKSAKSIDDMNHQIRKAIYKIYDHINCLKETTKIRNEKKIISDVMTNINENYMKDISLEILAEMFSINSSYLSTLFKKVTGINFSEYLTRVRIEKAKSIIKNTNKKIFEIGNEVGYTSEKHFFVAFKKYTGISPSQYRNCV